MIDSNKCYECDSSENIHNHHVIPRIRGGKKTIPLCEKCHGKVHGLNFINHKKLVKEGLEKAKLRGIKLGTPVNLTNESRKKSVASRKKKALENENNILSAEFIKILIKNNKEITYATISELLNLNNYLTSRGKMHTPYSSYLLCKRYKLK